MASIAKLVVSLGANIAGFETDMKRASKNQAARMKQLEKEARDAGLALAAAFTAAGVAMTAMALKSTQTADQMQKMAQRTGLSTEALSKYAYVTDLADVSIEAFGKGVNKMQRALTDAEAGLGTGRRAFDRLGLSVSDLMKLSPEQQFEEIAGAIAGLESATLRTATAQEIFGKAGTELLSVMQGGKKGILALKEEAESFNLVISQEFADASAQFNDNMTKIGKLTEGTSNAFTQGILPALLDIQEGLLGTSRNFDVFRAAGEKVGALLKTLATAFVIVKESALLFGRVLLGSVTAVLGAMRAVISPTIGLVTALAEAFRSLAAGDFSGALDAIASMPTKITQEFNAAIEQVKTASGFLVEQFTTDLPAAIANVTKFFNTNAKVVDSTAGAYGDLGDQTKKTGEELKKFTDRQRVASKTISDGIAAVEAIEAAHEAYTQQLQAFIDIGDPVGAMVREFAEKVEFANQALAKGDITIQQYRASLNSLSNQLGQSAASAQQAATQVVKQSSLMTEAMLEGVRIIERSFQSMWQNILNGGNNIFDDLKDGFKAMLANMIHQASTRKIIMQIETLINGGQMNWKELGAGLAALGGQIIGSKLGGGGENANIGAALGGVIGSFMGPIGTAIGSVLGGLVGGLFDSSRPSVLQVSGTSNANASKSDTDSRIDTVFGTTFFRSRRLDQAAIAEFQKALTEFDKSIASFIDDNQIGMISDALVNWSKQVEGEAISAEELLNSRFATILKTFSADLQDFVNDAQGLEEQIARLQVGVGSEKLFADNSELFAGRTIKEFLAVVDAFQVGTKTITDAFNEVLALLNIIDSVSKSLDDFGKSNLAADFDTLLRLQSESVVETVTRLTLDLARAVHSFDGSPEQLVQIGNLALSVRQQELNALSLIDSVAKGLNANLDRLLKDTKRTIEGPQAPEEILFDARALIDTVAAAQTPEEIAKLGQEFEALIRSLNPEDTKAFGTSTLAIIEAFQAASNFALENARQSVLDSAEGIRLMVDGFTAMIDPLEIIASSNERAALALEALAGTEGVTTANSESFRIGFDEGTDKMSAALRDGVQDMSGQLANAIRTGFSNANVSVNVVIQDQGLVTQ